MYSKGEEIKSEVHLLNSLKCYTCILGMYNIFQHPSPPERPPSLQPLSHLKSVWKSARSHVIHLQQSENEQQVLRSTTADGL